MRADAQLCGSGKSRIGKMPIWGCFRREKTVRGIRTVRRVAIISLGNQLQWHESASHLNAPGADQDGGAAREAIKSESFRPWRDTKAQSVPSEVKELSLDSFAGRMKDQLPDAIPAERQTKQRVVIQSNSRYDDIEGNRSGLMVECGNVSG